MYAPQTQFDPQILARLLANSGQTPAAAPVSPAAGAAPNPMASMPAFMPNVPMQATPQAPAIPPMPPHLPDGSLYSPSRSMWKTPDGVLYHADGQPASSPAGVQ